MLDLTLQLSFLKRASQLRCATNWNDIFHGHREDKKEQVSGPIIYPLRMPPLSIVPYNYICVLQQSL